MSHPFMIPFFGFEFFHIKCWVCIRLQFAISKYVLTLNYNNFFEHTFLYISTFDYFKVFSIQAEICLFELSQGLLFFASKNIIFCPLFSTSHYVQLVSVCIYSLQSISLSLFTLCY